MHRTLLVLLILLPGLLMAVIHMEAIYPIDAYQYLAVENGIMVMTHPANATEQLVSIYDNSNPVNPVLLSSFQMVKSYKPEIHNSYVYFPNVDYFIRYNITNPHSPVFDYQYNLAADAHLLSIAFSGNLMLCGTYFGGLRILDVSAENSATEVSNLNVEYNTYPRVWADGNRAAVICYNHVFHNSVLKLIDLSNPSNPQYVANIPSTYVNNDLISVCFYSNILYVSSATNQTETYNIGNLANPIYIGTLGDGGFPAAAIRDGFRYLVWGEDLLVQSMEDPLSPQDLGAFQLNCTGDVRFEFDLPYIYATVYDGLDAVRCYCLDVSDPSIPEEIVYTYETGVGITDITAWQNYLYYNCYIAEINENGEVGSIAENPLPYEAYGYTAANGLLHVFHWDDMYRIYSLTNPLVPELLSTTMIGGCSQVRIFGDYSLVDNYRSMYLYDISDPTQPEAVGSVDTYFHTCAYRDSSLYGVDSNLLYRYALSGGTFAQADSMRLSEGANTGFGMTLRGDYLYVAGNGQMWVFDTSDPSDLTPINQVALPIMYDAVYADPKIYEDRYLSVMTYDSNQILYYDLINPALPVLVAQTCLPFGAESLMFIGNRAFVVDGSILYGLQIPVATGIDNPEATPQIGLSNYPNPFNRSTTVAYKLDKAGRLELSVYNVKGQKVKELVNEHKSTGDYSLTWNGEDQSGQKLPSGVYLIKVKQGSITAVHKILKLK